jgi:SsrA-binding protein|tara:strand:+ start:294 stop:764 length:471 start_codon:yes stop_codon:yes gene_type:complete
MKAKKNTGIKIVCNNRKARFNYFFEELIEAGIVLKGSEVKSLREGKANITDSYATDSGGEIYLVNSHIPLYKQSSYNNHNPRDMRKLLLKKKEVNNVIGRINRDGLTVIPTKIYFKKGKAKVEIAISKGKKLFDKRETKKKRDWQRDQARILSRKK